MVRLLSLNRLRKSKPTELNENMHMLLGAWEATFLFVLHFSAASPDSSACFGHEGQALHSTMLFPRPGKHKSQRSLPAMSASAGHKLLFIQDTISSRRLLVDSGAQSSILPVAPAELLANGHGPPLDAANRTSIRTFGTRYVTVFQ